MNTVEAVYFSQQLCRIEQNVRHTSPLNLVMRYYKYNLIFSFSQNYLSTRGKTWKEMLQEALQSTQQGLYHLSGRTHTHFHSYTLIYTKTQPPTFCLGSKYYTSSFIIILSAYKTYWR